MRTTSLVFTLVSAGLIASSASAGTITFIDAFPRGPAAPASVSGNTTINGADLDFTSGTGNATTTTSSTDNKWRSRPDDASMTANNVKWTGGRGWECDASATLDENTAPLKISIDLNPGTYNLYGFFFDQRDNGTTNAFYDAAFSVDTTGAGPGAFANFTQFNSPLAAAGDFDDATGIVLTTFNDNFATTTPWDLLEASLGQITLAAPTTIDIYVQGPQIDYTNEAVQPTGWTAANFNINQRTEFDGVGIQAVPEPSPIVLVLGALVGVTGLTGARRRHDRCALKRLIPAN